VIDLSALHQHPAAALAAEIFAAALAATPGRLTPLASGNGAFVDVRVELTAAGPEGTTEVLFQNPVEVIAAHAGPITQAPLTATDIRNRKLLFRIRVNTAVAGTTGRILQTLRHEYAGHASPWGGYLGPLVAPVVAPGQHEQALAWAMQGVLWGGVQHLKIAEGRASYFLVLGARIEELLASREDLQQARADYLAAETADLANLRTTVVPQRELILATTDADLTDDDLVEIVVPTPSNRGLV